MFNQEAILPLEEAYRGFVATIQSLTEEQFVSSFGDKQAEIGAVTREAYRGRGYAPVACAHLIQACEQRGYQAYWSCDTDNRASIRVAQKLGFQQVRTYQILEYHAS